MLLQLLLELGRRAGLPIADEVRSLFAHLLDHDEQVQGQRQGLRPDLVATMHAAMRTGGRETLRQVLMDIKTVFAGGGAYVRARASRQRSRAVEVREGEVPEEVRRTAREADWAMARRAAVAAGRADPGQRMPRGYVGAALTAYLDASFPPVRGLVAGSYGEISPELRRFVRRCAELTGEREWREMGARSAAEASGILQGQMLRRLSVASHAGHMRVLHQRLRYVGMSHA